MSVISGVVDEINLQNDAGYSMPPVLPHQMVKLRVREFYFIVHIHEERLPPLWIFHHVNRIYQEFKYI